MTPRESAPNVFMEIRSGQRRVKIPVCLATVWTSVAGRLRSVVEDVVDVRHSRMGPWRMRKGEINYFHVGLDASILPTNPATQNM